MKASFLSGQFCLFILFANFFWNNGLSQSSEIFNQTSDEFCSCAKQEVMTNDWVSGFITCNREILSTSAPDFLKLEYALRNEFPDRKMSDLIWEYQRKLLVNSLNYCEAFKDQLPESKIDTFLTVFSREIYGKEISNWSISGKGKFVTSLLHRFLEVNNNDTISVLFENATSFNDRKKDLAKLSLMLRKYPSYSCYFEHVTSDDNDYVTATFIAVDEPFAQYVLTFKQNNLFLRLSDFQLIEKNEIKFDSSLINELPSPPPAPTITISDPDSKTNRD